jgi:ABC-type glycerol-3-phosphate transport system substrate-binding protein
MKTSKFQIIVLIVFIVFIVAGVALFATYKGSSSQNQLPSITVWGTFPKDKFDAYVAKINNSQTTPLSIAYTEKSPAAFLGDFVAALARGKGPDAVLVPSDVLLPSEDKLTPIPYAAYPQRDFINAYVDEARVYLSPQGILGIPFSIDPMVMYWNRDTFNAAGIATPPKTWDDFSAVNSSLTEKSDNGTVTKSAIALGDFSNVINAREILGSLMLQSGNPITQFDQYGSVGSALAPGGQKSPVAAVTFFTKFVDPRSPDYSWNKSWPDSKTAFVSGKLATYFGLASELFNIRAKNPNLNFDVAPFPQAKSGGVAAVYGKMYAFSIVKQSPNAQAVFTIVQTLTSPQYLVQLSNDLYLPSVARSIIAAGSSDPYIDIFNKAALIARTWLDADPAQSRAIFAAMTQAITTGQKSVFQAVSDASEQYQYVLTQAVGQ